MADLAGTGAGGGTKLANLCSLREDCMLCLAPNSAIRLQLHKHHILSQVFGLGKENWEKQNRLMD